MNEASPLAAEELRRMNAYWRAVNYLSVGQIYLLDNPLLREPLNLAHIKPRLLGHWGTTPGLNFIYVHLNRLIKLHDLNVIYVAGPGHGGPGLVANTYLEGTYSEFYPNISQDKDGLKKLFKQFSFPGGIPSHVAPTVFIICSLIGTYLRTTSSRTTLRVQPSCTLTTSSFAAMLSFRIVGSVHSASCFRNVMNYWRKRTSSWTTRPAFSWRRCARRPSATTPLRTTMLRCRCSVVPTQTSLLRITSLAT